MNRFQHFIVYSIYIRSKELFFVVNRTLFIIMIQFRNSKSQRRNQREFILHSNVQEVKLPNYDSFQDPHLSNYFFFKQSKLAKKFRHDHPIYSIYNSNKNISSKIVNKPSARLPSITRLHKKKFKPLTADQFKKVIMKYRKSENITDLQEEYTTD